MAAEDRTENRGRRDFRKHEESPRESRIASNTCTAIFERDGEWYIACGPEVPGANGQGRTRQEARESLACAIEPILQDRPEDAPRGVPDDAGRDVVVVP